MEAAVRILLSALRLLEVFWDVRLIGCEQRQVNIMFIVVEIY